MGGIIPTDETAGHMSADILRGAMVRWYGDGLTSGTRFQHLLFLEEERYAPDRADAYQYIDDARKHRRLSAENERHQIKLEYAYESPVHSADDQKQ